MSGMAASLPRKYLNCSIRKGSISDVLLYFAIFCLGLGFHAVYIFVLLVFFAVKPRYILNPVIKKSFACVFILISIFLIPQYVIGYQQMNLDSPLLSMLSVMFSIVVFGGLLQQLSPFFIKTALLSLLAELAWNH